MSNLGQETLSVKSLNFLAYHVAARSLGALQGLTSRLYVERNTFENLGSSLSNTFVNGAERIQAFS